MFDTKNNVRNARYTQSGDVGCEVKLGENWIPFTACKTDPEPFGVFLFNLLSVSSDINIAEYVDHVLTEDELIVQEREVRDVKLRQLDKIVQNPLRWSGFTTEQQSTIAEYRTALLDVPQQSGFPSEFEWPVMPEFIQ